MPSFHTLKVSAVERLHREAVVVSFEVPDSLNKNFVFLAGQYVTLEVDIKGQSVRRSYSLCSSPSEKTLQVGVKEVSNGVFSTYVNQHLKVGHVLKVSEPEGRFIYDSSQHKGSVLAIAAGSGITPVFSILKQFLKEEKTASFRLLYGNKSPKQTMFYDELLALEKAHPNQLKIHWVFSQSSEEDAIFGRINAATLNFVLKQDPQTPEQVYLCGPEAMIHTSKEHLIESGISKETIHFELFTASTDTKEVENPAEKGRLTLLCDEVTHDLELVTGKTLLDIALNAKLEVPYSCQGGVCSSCIARVKKGKASMLTNQILTDSEVEEGLVLSCQAIAQTDFIFLDFDDV